MKNTNNTNKILGYSPAILGGEWLLNSNIQNSSGNNKGAFNSWLDKDLNTYPYVYSEITGYGITTLLYLEENLGFSHALYHAIEAANWLILNAILPNGGVLTRDYGVLNTADTLCSFASGNVFAFDCGMVLYAMSLLYKRTLCNSYLDCAIKLSKFLLTKMSKANGQFYPIYNHIEDKAYELPLKWSTMSGSYHAKLVLGLMNMFEITADKVYKDAACNLIEGILFFQHDCGRFITSANQCTDLHPHLYSAEGILYAGIKLNKKEFIKSAINATKWVIESCIVDKLIPEKILINNEKCAPYRSDVLAQTLRLGIILLKFNLLEEKYQLFLQEIYDKLIQYQYIGNDYQKGGVYYQLVSNESMNQKKCLNSWCTMFFIQAAHTYHLIYKLKIKEVDLLKYFI